MKDVILKLNESELGDVAEMFGYYVAGRGKQLRPLDQLGLLILWIKVTEADVDGRLDLAYELPLPRWGFPILRKALVESVEVPELRRKVDLLAKQLKEARKVPPKRKRGKARRSTPGAARPAATSTTGSTIQPPAAAAAAGPGSS